MKLFVVHQGPTVSLARIPQMAGSRLEHVQGISAAPEKCAVFFYDMVLMDIARD